MTYVQESTQTLARVEPVLNLQKIDKSGKCATTAQRGIIRARAISLPKSHLVSHPTVKCKVAKSITGTVLRELASRVEQDSGASLENLEYPGL